MSQIGLEQQSVVQFSEECYLDYSMYVILERALPFVGDRIMFHNNRDLCINRNNHHKPTFHPLGDFLNPALALLGQGLKKSPIGQKLDFANHPYLCKGL
jgi:hypothetical protein